MKKEAVTKAWPPLYAVLLYFGGSNRSSTTVSIIRISFFPINNHIHDCFCFSFRDIRAGIGNEDVESQFFRRSGDS